MPAYQYTGKLASGKMVRGEARAENKEQLTQKLLQEGISPTEIKEKAFNLNDIMQRSNEVLGLDKPNLKDLSILARQLLSLTRAGVSIVQAISSIIHATENETLKHTLKEVVGNVESGQSLAASLGKYPKVFPNIMVILVNVGENTGGLDRVFEQLSFHFERERETGRRIKEATRYPIIVIIVIGIAIIVINMLVIPAFSGFFNKFGAELPLPTKILIKSSYIMVNYWYLLLLGAVGLAFAWASYLKTQSGRLKWDHFKIRIPLIGSIIQRALLARFVRSFALCIRTGVPLLETIQMIAKTTDNSFVAGKISNMRTNIEHGEALTIAATKSNMFTPLVLQMMKVGEESGDVENLLDEVGHYYEQELDYDLKQLGDAIEPILIVVIAIMVLILALGVFLPMWDISRVALHG